MLYLARTIFLAICMTILSAVPFVSAQEYNSDNWFPVRVNGKTGYIDRTGRIVIEPQFDGASYFSEGLAVIAVGRDTIYTEGYNQGYIDEAGTIVIKPQWDVTSSFSEGLASVGFDQTKQKGKIGNRTYYTSSSHPWYRWGFIDKTGKTVIEAKFSDVSEFRDGIAAANTDPYEPKYGFIDKQGNWIIQPQFEHASQFVDGLALVFIKSKYGFIDKTGKMAIKPQFTSARDFSEGFACVRIGGDVIRPVGMSITKNPGRHAFIDKTGKAVITLKNASCRSFSEGLAVFEEYGKYGEGFIDKTGKVVIAPNGSGQSEFSEGLKFVILEGGKLGFIDRTGTVVLQPPYGKMDDFRRGLSEVCESYESDAKCGYMDRAGKLVWPLTR